MARSRDHREDYQEKWRLGHSARVNRGVYDCPERTGISCMTICRAIQDQSNREVALRVRLRRLSSVSGRSALPPSLPSRSPSGLGGRRRPSARSSTPCGSATSPVMRMGRCVSSEAPMCWECLAVRRWAMRRWRAPRKNLKTLNVIGWGKWYSGIYQECEARAAP